MAGSDHSGQDMESGRTNRAEDQTRIWAQREGDGEFSGDVIFVVEGARDIEDDDFGEVSAGLHAIRGSSNGGAGLIGLSTGKDLDIALATSVGVFGKGRTGVRGQGSPGVEGIGLSNGTGDGRGIGVVGRGDRRAEGGVHGPGVVGLGGRRPKDPLALEDEIVSGTGVFGQGVEGEKERRPGVGVVGRGGIPLPGGSIAPGVVGLSVGLTASGGAIFLPELDTGVFGLGATGVTGHGHGGPGVRGAGGPNGPIAEANPDAAQAGVVGEAGTVLDHGGGSIFGAGVIGVAGVSPPLSFAEVGETGVYGAGQTGVKGFGFDGRGGVFVSQRDAQVQLVPSPGTRIVEQAAFIPTIARAGPSLPPTGRGGDLMTIADDQKECTLWFCVRGGNTDRPAKWTQVLLGPAFDGRA